jgi:acyl-CoA synthetase (AMP-forming)/AMP-acid ligase II
MPPVPFNIAALVDAAAAGDPDRPALVMEDGTTVSYAHLSGEAARWSTTLRAHGVAPGDRVALTDWGGLRSTAATLGAAAIGAATAHMSPLLTESELAQLVTTAGCAPVAISGPDAAGALAAALGRAGRVLDEPDEDPSSGPAQREGGGAGTALVLFTSGTTGVPKAVPITHDSVLARVSAYRPAFDTARAPSRPLMCVPSFHVGGLLGLLLGLYTGDTTVVQPRFDAGRWLDLVDRHQVTSAFLVPTMLARILDHPDRGDIPSVTSISYGAAAAPVDLVQRAMDAWPHVAFANVFGQTETLGAYTTLTAADHRDPARIGSVGRVLPGVEVRVVDPVTGVDVPTGEVGELWVSSPQNVESGWLHTGDLARQDADGYLYPSGRMSDTINRGGEKFSPSEIAEVLRRHPDVADAAVAGVPDPEMGERVGVAVVTRDGAAVELAALREWCQGRLAPFKRPEVLVVVDALPYNALGKLPRRAVVELITEGASL